MITLLLGYLLFLFRIKIKHVQIPIINALGYWMIVILMLADAFNPQSDHLSMAEILMASLMDLELINMLFSPYF